VHSIGRAVLASGPTTEKKESAPSKEGASPADKGNANAAPEASQSDSKRKKGRLSHRTKITLRPRGRAVFETRGKAPARKKKRPSPHEKKERVENLGRPAQQRPEKVLYPIIIGDFRTLKKGITWGKKKKWQVPIEETDIAEKCLLDGQSAPLETLGEGKKNGTQVATACRKPHL